MDTAPSYAPAFYKGYMTNEELEELYCELDNLHNLAFWLDMQMEDNFH
jgi:hypothetical protein